MNLAGAAAVGHVQVQQHLVSINPLVIDHLLGENLSVSLCPVHPRVPNWLDADLVADEFDAVFEQAPLLHGKLARHFHAIWHPLTYSRG